MKVIAINYVDCVALDKIKWLCAFTKYTTQKLVTKPQSISMSCHELDLVHLILNADIKLSLMRKTSGNVFLGHLGERVFNIFQMLHSIMIYGLGNVGLHVFILIHPT